MPATRLPCPLPSCVRGLEEMGQDDDGEPCIEVEAGGRYLTPAHLATIAQTQDDLKLPMDAQKLSVPTSTPSSAPAPRDSKPAKLEHPKVEMDMSEPEWGLYEAEWERYCRSCRLTDPQERVDQLLGCLSPTLKRAAAGDGLETVVDDGEFLAGIKKLAVKKHNPLVAQVKFLSTGQDRDEPVNSYVARLRGVALQCNFNVRSPCPCGTSVSYSDRMIAHMLVRGMEDLAMQEKVLTLVAEKGEQSLVQLVTHIEVMETSKRSQGRMGSGQLSRVGSSRSGGAKPKDGGQPKPSGAKCSGCGQDKAKHKGGVCFAKNLECNNCGKQGHIGRVCKQPKKNKGGVKNVTVETTVPEPSTGEVSLVESPTKDAGFFFADEINKVGVSHHIHVGGAWRARKVMPHPTLEVSVDVDSEAYKQLSLQKPAGGSGARMVALADTGAQICILGRSQVHELGVKVEDLEPASLGITIADGGRATNLGMLFLMISARTPDGGWRTTRQQCYVLDGAASLFLSYEALVELGSCPKGFPQVAAVNVIGDRLQARKESGPGPQALPGGGPTDARESALQSLTGPSGSGILGLSILRQVRLSPRPCQCLTMLLLCSTTGGGPTTAGC